MLIAVTAALALSSASLRPLVSLVHELFEASHCQLNFLQLGRLPRELSGDPHEFKPPSCELKPKKAWVQITAPLP